MRKLCTCLFYGLCVFTIVFSLFWMALPKLSLPVPGTCSKAAKVDGFHGPHRWVIVSLPKSA